MVDKKYILLFIFIIIGISLVMADAPLLVAPKNTGVTIIGNLTTYYNITNTTNVFNGGNATFNQTLTDSIYSQIKWGYNQSSIYNLNPNSYYNVTTLPNSGGDNASWSEIRANTLYSTIIWSYNQSIVYYQNPLGYYNVTTLPNQGGGNSTWNETRATSLFASIIWGYNQTYSGSTFNTTYNQWAYNQSSIYNVNPNTYFNQTGDNFLYTNNTIVYANLSAFDDRYLRTSTNYFLYNTSSGIGSFYKMNTTISDGVEKVETISSLSGTQNIRSWINQNTNLTSIQTGFGLLHIHVEKTAGLKSVQLYANLTIVNESGFERQFIVSETSNALAFGTNFMVLNLAFPNVVLNVTDRIGIDLYSVTTGAGGAPTIVLHTEGNTLSALSLPTTSSSSQSNGGNSTWNEIRANTLYSPITYGYNQSSIYNVNPNTYYNVTTLPAQSGGNSSWNETRANLLYSPITWGYNMTTPFTTWLGTFVYNYNQTYSGSIFNITYQNFAYNQTYSGSTFNTTYANYAYNQSTYLLSQTNLWTKSQTVNGDLNFTGNFYDDDFSLFYNFTSEALFVQNNITSYTSNSRYINVTNNINLNGTSTTITSNGTTIFITGASGAQLQIS